MATTSDTAFIAIYDHLISMFQGCSGIMKLLDDFGNFLNSITGPGEPFPGYEGPAILLQYRDMYGVRKRLYDSVTDYLSTYQSDLSSSYKTAMDVLNKIKYDFNIIVNLKTIDSIVFYINAFPERNYQKQLATNLRDPLMSAIKIVTTAQSDAKQSGGITKQSDVETTNSIALQIANLGQARMQDPVVQRWTSNLRAEDIHDFTVSYVKDKAKDHIQQKSILTKLANGQYLADIVNNFETNASKLLNPVSNAVTSFTEAISSNIAKYVFRNSVYGSISISDAIDPQGKNLKSVMRERTRKRFGDVRFCDEAEEKDANGNWILKDQAASLALLEKSRKALINKMLKYKQ